MRKPISYIETSSSYIYYDNSILEIKIKADTLFEKEQIIEQIRISKELVRADTYSVLIVANVISNTSNDALLFLMNSTFFNIKGVAVVTNNLANRLIANHFKKTSRINPDFQIFKSKRESVNWLKKDDLPY